MAGGNGRQRQAVAPKQGPAKPEPAKKPTSAGGNGRQREKK